MSSGWTLFEQSPTDPATWFSRTYGDSGWKHFLSIDTKSISVWQKRSYSAVGWRFRIDPYSRRSEHSKRRRGWHMFEFSRAHVVLMTTDPPRMITYEAISEGTVTGIINPRKKSVEIDSDQLRNMGLATYEFKFNLCSPTR